MTTPPPPPAPAGRGLDARTREVTRLTSILSVHVDNRPDILLRYTALLPDGAAALECLWKDLAHSPTSPTRGWSSNWTAPLDDDEARHLLYLLVQLAGWHRVKVCSANNRCARPFLDSTNGGSRSACARHSRNREKRSH